MIDRSGKMPAAVGWIDSSVASGSHGLRRPGPAVPPMEMTVSRDSRFRRGPRVLVAAFGITLAADVISKVVAQHLIAGSPLTLLGDFQLRVLYNSRAPIGLGHSIAGNAVLTAAAAVAVTLLIWAWATNRRESLEIGIMAGGVAGNLIDRVMGGSVLDWIDPGVGGVFNLADVAIMVGLAMFITSYRDDERAAERTGQPLADS